MEDLSRRKRLKRRLDRQFDAISHLVPPARTMVARMRHPRFAPLRIPVGIVLLIGGVLSILPVFGLWMLPLGLLLLAVDVPLLRPLITTALVRLRRRVSMIRRRLR